MLFNCKNTHIHKQSIQGSSHSLDHSSFCNLTNLSQTIASAASFIRIKNTGGHWESLKLIVENTSNQKTSLMELIEDHNFSFHYLGGGEKKARHK